MRSRGRPRPDLPVANTAATVGMTLGGARVTEPERPEQGEEPTRVSVTGDGSAVLARSDDLAHVYRAAFCAPGSGEPPSAVDRFRDDQLPAHTGRDGFRCALAERRGLLIGFAYGYTGEHGQWWTDHVTARVPPEVAKEWLGGHFEFVQLAVDPIRQRRGLGEGLVTRLLEGLPHARALLTTYRDDRPATRLYRRLGWTLLAEHALEGSDLYGFELR